MNSKYLSITATALLLCITTSVNAKPQSASDGSEDIFRALKNQHAIDPARKLLSMNYICKLKVGNTFFSVIDTYEITQPQNDEPVKGVSQIILMNNQMHIVKKIDRPRDATPLLCHGEKIYLDAADLDAYNGQGPGNTIAVSHSGDISVTSTPKNNFPVLQTSQRSSF